MRCRPICAQRCVAYWDQMNRSSSSRSRSHASFPLSHLSRGAILLRGDARAVQPGHAAGRRAGGGSASRGRGRGHVRGFSDAPIR